MKLPILAITMGDPAGIGPEVAVKALIDPQIKNIARCFIVGDSSFIRYAIKFSKLPGITINSIEDIKDAEFIPNKIDVLETTNIGITKVEFGKVSSLCGKASVEYIEKAIELAKSKKIAGIVTGPINKEAIHKAGYKFNGHTELLAKRTKTKKYAMAFVSDEFWVVLVTTHIPLKQVPKKINKNKVLESIKFADQMLKRAGRDKGKIAVAGLNPHAGEGGIFGKEEQKYIKPAIEEAKKQGINVYGPISPDAVFNLANSGLFDVVVAMYHDQGLIPLKLLSFNKSVNITIGLPIIRTSVDHGTGFDMVCKGWANPGSMIQAIKVAASFAQKN